MWGLFEENFKLSKGLFNILWFTFPYPFSGDKWTSHSKTSDQTTFPEKRRRLNKIH